MKKLKPALVKLKKRRNLVKIQSFFRMRLEMRKYILLREQNIMFIRKQKLEAAKLKLKRQKLIKESVKIIEAARYRQLHLRELRMCRKYLKRLPYECRGVYFKFMDVKRSSNELMHSYKSFLGNN